MLKMASVLLLLIDARVSTLDGNMSSGAFKSLNDQQIVLTDASGKDNTVSLAEALTLQLGPDNRPAADKNQIQVILTDGSTVPASEITGTSAEINSTSELLGDIKIPRLNVRALVLQPVKSDWMPQWDAILARSNEKDMLVVEKRDGTGLDFLAGIVSSITASEVPFLLDGNEIPVPRPRVVGIVFAKSDNPTVSRDFALQLRNGFVLRGRSVRLRGDDFEFEASWGQKLQIAVSHVAGIDFSSGRLHYLSDLEPINERYFGLDPPGKEWGPLFEDDRSTRTGLSSQWRMSRDRFPNSGRPPLTLRGTVYQKGLCIFPRAQIDYALDGQYSSLRAIVGVDDDVAFNQLKGEPETSVAFRIEADGAEVFKRLVKAPEDPFPVNIKLSGVNTLSIIVDFGDGSSMCDYLDIADARLVVDTSEK